VNAFLPLLAGIGARIRMKIRYGKAFYSLSSREGLRPAPTQSRQRAGVRAI
jgi:hypothetical protein